MEVFRHGGFDIVVANPPYIRQEKFSSEEKDIYEESFPQVYAGTADILVFFYARAIQILKPGGWLAFITSNKYMRAAYGDGLRGHLPHSLEIGKVIDFGDLPLFESNGRPVAAYPAVLIGRKAESDEEHTLHVAELTFRVRQLLAEAGRRVNVENVRWALEGLESLLEVVQIPEYPQVLLRREGWILEDPVLVRLFDRLMAQGTPLGEYVQGRMYRGVVTGLNEAFVIDQAKRDELVAADPRSAELIKPWLRGRDIKRWRAEWAGLYVIAIQNCGDADAANPWATAPTEAEARRILYEAYPAVHDHLSQFENRLRPRADQGRFWWELRACTYYSEFEQPKIVWPDITAAMRFAWDTDQRFLANTAYAAVGSSWLVVLLNSTLARFIIGAISSLIRGGYIRLIYGNVAPFPIVEPPDDVAKHFSFIAEHGGGGLTTPTIDEAMADLYSLTQAEKSILKEWSFRTMPAAASSETPLVDEDD